MLDMLISFFKSLIFLFPVQTKEYGKGGDGPPMQRPGQPAEYQASFITYKQILQMFRWCSIAISEGAC